MTFTITPYTSAGPIMLGMSREAVHQLFDVAPRPFIIDTRFEIETDLYESLGFFVFYNSSYLCVAVEIYNPNAAVFENVNLLTLSLKEAKSFWARDSHLQKDDVGYRSYEYGIAAYYESKRKPENIIVFTKNYYDE